MAKIIYKKSTNGRCRKYEHSVWIYEGEKLKEIISQDTDEPKITKHQLADKVRQFFRENPNGIFVNMGWV